MGGGVVATGRHRRAKAQVGVGAYASGPHPLTLRGAVPASRASPAPCGLRAARDTRIAQFQPSIKRKRG